MVPVKTAALLDQLVIDRYWRSGWWGCANWRGALPLWECVPREHEVAERSHWEVLSLLNLAIHMKLSHHLATSAEVDFVEGVLAAALCVQLLKAHLQLPWLYQACCLDSSPVWMCLRKVTEVEVLLVTGVVWEVQLTCETTVCHFPCLLVPRAEQGMEMVVPGTF